MEQIVSPSVRPNDGGKRQASLPSVTHFRQILVWPVYLLPLPQDSPHQDRWTLLSEGTPGSPWHEVEDEFGDPSEFQERHYSEFVTFLPPVQRFLYGEGLGKSQRRKAWESPIKVMRRADIDRMRVDLSPDAPSIDLQIAHVDLYLFFDIDIAMLALEVYADDVPLDVAQDLMFKLGRAYPGFWEKNGRAGHCPLQVQFLSKTGEQLAVSDYQERTKFLSFACEHRAPRVASHWEYLLEPMVPHHSDKKGQLRYRQLEYYRMPFMAYLAVDRPELLTRGDHVRLGLAAEPGAGDALPYGEQYLTRFENDHCYDRHHGTHASPEWCDTRYLSCGHTLVVTGRASNAFFVNPEHGVLGMFRHQHFLLFLIAHFHKSALLMFSDRLAGAVSRLEVGNAQALIAFRNDTRQAHETFLRFTHRYWFHEVSNHEQARDLFELCRRHLNIDRLYEDVRLEVRDMSEYLENEAMRRQNESMMRLTVVTTFGLIGTIVTGFLGMNLFSHSELEPQIRFLIFLCVFVPIIWLTLYTVKKSRRLSEFLDVLADETSGLGAKSSAFWRIWGRRKPPPSLRS